MSAGGPAPGDEVAIDVERLSEVAAGCGWSLVQLAEFYAPRARQEIADVESAAASGDRDTLARVSHGAAGSNATIGIDSMAARFRAISERSRSSQPATGDAHVGEVVRGLGGHLELVLARLDEIVAESV